MNPDLAGLKTLNRLESVLARGEWRDARVWEGLMRDVDGNVVCGTMSNFFIKRGSFLLTPMLDRCGVAGVMRRWVLEQAGRLSLRALEGRLRWEELGEAEEVFMTNAVAGIVPVAVIQDGAERIEFEHTETARAAARAPGIAVKTRLIVVAIMLLALCAGVAGALVWRGLRSLDEPVKLTAPLRFKVPAGCEIRACGRRPRISGSDRTAARVGPVRALQGCRLRHQGR